MREIYAPNTLPQAQFPLEVSNHKHTSPKHVPQTLAGKVIPPTANQPHQEPITSCPTSRVVALEPTEQTFLNPQAKSEQKQDWVGTRLDQILIHEDEADRGVQNKYQQKEGTKYVDQNLVAEVSREELGNKINLEQNNKYKLKENHGVLYPLFIKEYSTHIKQNQIMTRGTYLNPNSYSCNNLLSLHAEKQVLRTKLCQEREYDEVKKENTKHSTSFEEDNNYTDFGKDQSTKPNQEHHQRRPDMIGNKCTSPQSNMHPNKEISLFRSSCAFPFKLPN